MGVLEKSKNSRKDHRRKYLYISFAVLIVAIATIAVSFYFFDRFVGEKPAIDLSDLIAMVGLAIGLFVGMLAILPALDSLEQQIKESTQSTKSGHYAELDAIFMNILSMAIERPYLRDPDDGKKGVRKQEYETYAYLVFNFIETLRDRSKDDDELRRTWGPIIISEATLHWQWFEGETTCRENHLRPKFCAQFCDFLHRHKANDFFDLAFEDDLVGHYEVDRDASTRSLTDRLGRIMASQDPPPRIKEHKKALEVERRKAAHVSDRRSVHYDPWRYREEADLRERPYSKGKEFSPIKPPDVRFPWYCAGP